MWSTISAIYREEREAYLGLGYNTRIHHDPVDKGPSRINDPCVPLIYSISETGEPIIGRLATSSTGELKDVGLFSRSSDYFAAVANTSIEKLDSSAKLGALVFRDILLKTTLFRDMDTNKRFPLNHMDLGTQNILVDDEFNFIAIIDWEFAQTALLDPSHLAHKNVLRQDFSRRIYNRKFQEAERELEERERPLGGSVADTLNKPA
uniref:Aminoglycoside phosphotransferase domain-containing protein n=1 Tax=Bionectria ochroleuca TaxID=29856 RepID=A0A8H7TR47_BIOOC